MDQLEKYIHDNRDQFDDRNPDPGIWAAIEARLPQQESKRVGMWKWTAVAAVGLVLVLSGVIAGMSVSKSDFMDTAEYMEFRETEQYYNGQYNNQLTKLSAYEYDPGIDQDLDELGEIYNELTEELLEGAHPDKNQVIEALITNYQTRIDLLERVLERLDEGNQRKQKIDEDETTKI